MHNLMTTTSPFFNYQTIFFSFLSFFLSLSWSFFLKKKTCHYFLFNTFRYKKESIVNARTLFYKNIIKSQKQVKK
ncbi:hypothetical protein EDC94DRAFT_610974 [Helicostylum pulchrum]|nr:hypothetical protein EDC94DRAFT_610974 [Helicostylum pulchrum]